MRKQRRQSVRSGKEQSCGTTESDLAEERRSRRSKYGGGFDGYHGGDKKWMYVCVHVFLNSQKGKTVNRGSENKRHRPLLSE